jgi:hypothetical protein
VSLGVEAGDPSVRLYRSAGFAAVAGAAEGTMAIDLEGASAPVDARGRAGSTRNPSSARPR